MNTEYTEPFDLGRWIAGEPAIGLIKGRVITFKRQRENGHFDVNEVEDDEHGYTSLYTMTRHGRMKTKASNDGWIPVINKTCPAAAREWKAGEYEWRDESGLIYTPKYADAINEISTTCRIAAVRLIKPAKQTIQENIDAARKSVEQRPEWMKDKAFETPKQRDTRQAWERFTQSSRYREMHPQPVAMIGEVEESRIAGEALVAFDRVWPRKA